MARTFTLAVVFLALLWVPDRSCLADVPQNAKIAYDQSNYLVFEDVGRVESLEGGVTMGQYVRLHVTREGKQYDVEFKDPYYMIGNDMDEIRYRDKDTIWMIARQGHLWRKAILFNLATRQTLESYGGGAFTLSADAKKLAYVRDNPREGKPAVFVNHTMVYPVIEGGYIWHGYDADEPKRDGISYVDAFEKAGLTSSKLTSGLAWTTSSTLSVQVQEKPADSEQKRSVGYVISGIASVDDAVSSKTIHVTRSEVAVPAQ